MDLVWFCRGFTLMLLWENTAHFIADCGGLTFLKPILNKTELRFTDLNTVENREH